jgi:hypothetical protein
MMPGKQNLPEPLELSHAQREAIKPHLKKFRTYAESPRFKQDQELRRDQLDFFQREVPKRLPVFSEADLAEIVTRLWAARIWGDKQYLIQKIVSVNGIEKVKSELARLWDTALPVHDRYEHFVENISHLGPAAVTEMMCYIEPHRCGIWNKQAREALKVLGLDSFVSPTKYRLTGAEYETFNRLLSAIATDLSNSNFSDVDLLFVDFFLYEIAQSETPEEREQISEITAGHDEVRDMIAAIGAMLGFDTDVEFSIAPGAKVDVVWRARIGNLGVVTYVFEVQKGGSIDSLILSLQKAKNSPTVQKVVAVSDDEQLQKIERETQGLQAEFRNSLAFWKISEVQQVSQSLQAASEIINRLGLVPGKT